MKFRVIGTLGNGQHVDKVVDGSDERFVRNYAEKNGVSIKSIQEVNEQITGRAMETSRSIASIDSLSTLILIAGLFSLLISGFCFIGLLLNLGRTGYYSTITEEDIYAAILLLIFFIGSLGLLVIAAIRIAGQSICKAIKDR